MSVVRVGATKRFADNWENIFGGGKKVAGSKSTSKSAKKSAKKKVTAKLAGKKRSTKKKRG
jgi:hypothetical protein